MTQHEQALLMFEENKGKITLGDIMQTSLGCEYRARFSELREKGYDIECIKGKSASENTYYLKSAPSKTQYKGLFCQPTKKATLDTQIQEKVAQYRHIQSEYPFEHVERKKIENQITRIIERAKK